MGTTAEKLSYLNETKTKIKNALETPSNTFRDYPTLIKKYIDNQPTKIVTDGICNNAVELPIVSLGADGNSEQEATAGYQLFDWNGVSTPTIATYENGVAKLMWTGGFDVFFLNNSEQYLNDLDTTKEYTISFKHKGNAIRMSNYATSQYNVDTNNDNDYVKYSFTVTGVSFIRLDVIRKDTSGTAYIKELMVYEGTDDKLYEKYTEGIPSPNPDYKQDIEVIDGCNIFNGNFTTNGIWKDDGTINYTIQSKLYWRTDFVKIPNKNIFFSDNKLNIFSSAKLLEFDADKKYITSNKIYQVNSNLNKVSLNENTKFIAIQWDLQNEAEIESLFTEFQITEGTTQKPYLPHGAIGLEQSGKNKFDNRVQSQLNNNAKDTTLDKNKRITLTQATYSYAVFKIKQNVSDYAGKVVRLKADFTKSNSNLNPKYGVLLGDANYSQGRQLMGESTVSGYTINFNLPSTFENGKEYLYVRLYATVDKEGNIDDYVDFNNIILTIDNEDMTYEPYHEPKIIPIDLQGNTLAKVGDVKDILKVNRNGEVEIKKNVEKIVLTGSEKLVEKSSSTTRTYWGIDFSNYGIYQYDDSTKTCDILTTKFKARPQQGTFLPGQVALMTDTKNVYFIFEPDTTEEQARAILTDMPVYFRLAEPQTIKLSSISPIELWQGTNIFKLITNLETNFEVEYVVDKDSMLDEVQKAMLNAEIEI